MDKRRKLIIAAAIFLTVVGAGAYFFFQRPDRAITATGMIEVTQSDLTPKVGGYLVERNFKEGDQVTKEAILARIDKTDYRLAYLQAEGAYKSALAKLKDLEAGSRGAEIASYAAAMNATRLSMEKASSDYQRFSRLYQSGAISQQELDNYRLAMTTSQGNYQQAASAYQLAVEGSRTDAIEAQRHTVEQQKAALDAAKAQLGYTDVKSPLSGRILSKNYEAGEFVQAGAPLATIGDLSDCWVKIYVPSTLLGRVRFDQQAEVRIDSYPGKVFQGTVKEIATQAEFTPRQTITKDERANLVFAVKVYIDNKDGVFKPGMPAEVRLP